MYLEKIEIPSFRVLRDVVLEFGGVYDPQVFPLGSENGGGKSTALQLIFTLLHCSADPARFPYLTNLLATDSSPIDGEQKVIARLTIRIEDESHCLEFISLTDSFLTQNLKEDPPRHGFATEAELETVKMKMAGSRDQSDWERIQSLLLAHNQKYITTYSSSTQTRALVCRVQGQSAARTEELLLAASSKVFLLGPPSQQYLFLPKEVRKALLQTKQTYSRESPQIEYLTSLDEAESVLAGFLPYDWLSVEPLVKLFLNARDEDFKQVVKTGSYGERYNSLLKEVNTLLFGKRVRPLVGETVHILGVEFIVTDDSGAETPVSPEDLSQGELKRLMIYAWLRSNNIVDALVLIDEIETSFHPDWQIGIVRDLHEWGPKNQYILATHSYELCQALTPRHVRELRPPLRHGEGPTAEAKETGS